MLNPLASLRIYLFYFLNFLGKNLASAIYFTWRKVGLVGAPIQVPIIEREKKG